MGSYPRSGAGDKVENSIDLVPHVLFIVESSQRFSTEFDSRHKMNNECIQVTSFRPKLNISLLKWLAGKDR